MVDFSNISSKAKAVLAKAAGMEGDKSRIDSKKEEVALKKEISIFKKEGGRSEDIKYLETALAAYEQDANQDLYADETPSINNKPKKNTEMFEPGVLAEKEAISAGKKPKEKPPVIIGGVAYALGEAIRRSVVGKMVKEAGMKLIEGGKAILDTQKKIYHKIFD